MVHSQHLAQPIRAAAGVGFDGSERQAPQFGVCQTACIQEQRRQVVEVDKDTGVLRTVALLGKSQHAVHQRLGIRQTVHGPGSGVRPTDILRAQRTPPWAWRRGRR